MNMSNHVVDYFYVVSESVVLCIPLYANPKLMS